MKMPDDRVGEQFGDYQLKKLLGYGGFGDVYLAERLHGVPGEQVAVKIFKRQSEDPEQQIENIANFVKEANTTLQLRHPNIVRLIEFDVKNKTTPFLVMAYAPNGTLYKKHKNEKPTLQTIVLYTKQIAAALQYAHDHRHIHRDVKPDNILLGPNNELWLSDFGLSIIAHDTKSFTTQAVGGTVDYQAPEQHLGTARKASDQYSLGVVVYEWMSGSVPFKGATDVAIARQHEETSPPRLYPRVSGISREIEDVVMKALEKNPDRRFDTVQQFADELERVYNQEQKLLAEELSQEDSPLPVVPMRRANRPRPYQGEPVPRREPDIDNFDVVQKPNARVFRVPREQHDAPHIIRNATIAQRQHGRYQQVFSSRIPPEVKEGPLQTRRPPRAPRIQPTGRGQRYMPQQQSLLMRSKNFVLAQPLVEYLLELLVLAIALGLFYSSLNIFWIVVIVVGTTVLLLTVCRVLKLYEIVLALLAVLSCLWTIVGGKIGLITLAFLAPKWLLLEPLNIEGVTGAISFVIALYLHLHLYDIREKQAYRFAGIWYFLIAIVFIAVACGLLLQSWTALLISAVCVLMLFCIALLQVKHVSLLAMIILGASWSIVGYSLGVWFSSTFISNNWFPIVFCAFAGIIGTSMYTYKFYEVS